MREGQKESERESDLMCDYFLKCVIATYYVKSSSTLCHIIILDV